MFNKTTFKKAVLDGVKRSTANLTDAGKLKKEIEALTDRQAEALAAFFRAFEKRLAERLDAQTDKVNSQAEADAFVAGLLESLDIIQKENLFDKWIEGAM